MTEKALLLTGHTCKLCGHVDRARFVPGDSIEEIDDNPVIDVTITDACEVEALATVYLCQQCIHKITGVWHPPKPTATRS